MNILSHEVLSTNVHRVHTIIVQSKQQRVKKKISMNNHWNEWQFVCIQPKVKYKTKIEFNILRAANCAGD